MSKNKNKKLHHKRANYAAMFIAAQLCESNIRGTSKDRVKIAWEIAGELLKK